MNSSTFSRTSLRHQRLFRHIGEGVVVEIVRALHRHRASAGVKQIVAALCRPWHADGHARRRNTPNSSSCCFARCQRQHSCPAVSVLLMTAIAGPPFSADVLDHRLLRARSARRPAQTASWSRPRLPRLSAAVCGHTGVQLVAGGGGCPGYPSARTAPGLWSITPVMRLRVVCGFWVTIATFSPTR